MDTTTPPPVTSTDPAAPPPMVSATEDKTVAILSYITLIGFIAAVIVNSNKKTKLGAFHLRQAMGLFVTGAAIGIGGIVLAIIPILGILCLFAIWVAMLVFWVMGLISAIQGQMKPLPVVGPLYQKWFGTAFD
jgi:uncharacterized membrane protein